MSHLSDSGLQSLLADWHNWSNNTASAVRLGYASKNHIARLARFSLARQHGEDVVDDLDHRADESEMEMCDQIIGSMITMQAMAISLKAKHFAQRSSVWHNPRLPKGAELEALIDNALSVFRRRWDGVL